MADQVQRRGGPTPESNLFTGAPREMTIDTTKKVVVVHDGVKQGGYPQAREDLSNVTDKTLSSRMRSAGSALATDLAAKAPLNSPAFTGTPTTPTPAATDTGQQIANMEIVRTLLANLVASSPAALDTLNELAAALGNDPNFATTINNALANRVISPPNGNDGVTKLYNNDMSGSNAYLHRNHNVQATYTGDYIQLREYAGDTYYGNNVKVAYADRVASISDNTEQVHIWSQVQVFAGGSKTFAFLPHLQGQGQIEIRGGSDAAVIGFNSVRPKNALEGSGTMMCHAFFGLDTDFKFKVSYDANTDSRSPTRHEIWHAGNFNPYLVHLTKGTPTLGDGSQQLLLSLTGPISATVMLARRSSSGAAWDFSI